MVRSFNRLQARLQEFGATNGYLWTSDRLPPVFLNSIPKSGTNMLNRLMYISGIYRRSFSRTVGDDVALSTLRRVRPNTYLIAHSRYSDRLRADLAKAGLKHVLIVRNPISVAVSNVHYLTNPNTRHRLKNYFTTTLKTHEDRMKAILDGIPKDRFGGTRDSLRLLDHYRDFALWAQDPGCLVVRFEDLVGAAGQGSDQARDLAIESLLRHIGFDPDFSFPVENIFSSSSRTFRSGMAYGYSRDEFSIFADRKHREWDAVLDRLGYRAMTRPAD